MRYFSHIIIASLLLSCSFNSDVASSIIKEELTYAVNENDGYTIYVENTQIQLICNKPSETTQLVFDDSRKVLLDFYILNPYLSGAFLSEIQGMGKVLILESSVVGLGGKSSNITNVSIIFLEEQYWGKVVSYNSFYGGANLLEYKDDQLLLSIYDYDDITEDGNIIYCRTVFKYTDNGFIQQQSSNDCFIHSNDGSLKSCDNCKCNKLSKPYVMESVKSKEN